MGRPEERRSLGITRRGWKNNIKIDFSEVEYGAWTGLMWLRIGACGGHM